MLLLNCSTKGEDDMERKFGFGGKNNINLRTNIKWGIELGIVQMFDCKNDVMWRTECTKR